MTVLFKNIVTLILKACFSIYRIQSIANNKFLVVLELDDVIETDAGLYKVKAKNKMGEVAASINLNFSREYFFYSPFILNWFVLSGYISISIK